MINYRGLLIPFTQLGKNVTSDNLFDPNEQVIFDFYEANKDRYQRAVDIGANIGVHSILMARLGWQVVAYEPDPVHFKMLCKNLKRNRVKVRAIESAVSCYDGIAAFTRVVGNTTGSHLLGAKESYGERESFMVRTTACAPLFEWADFVKIDCEGHEAAIIDCVPASAWARVDAILEVGTEANARAIYQRLVDVIPMYAQKIDWQRVCHVSDMPMRHQDGSLFIGKQFTKGA